MPKKKTTKNEIEKLSFEKSIENLTVIVDKIETGQVSLSESLSQYEKGMELIKHCRKILLDAEKRIEKIADDQQEEPDSDEDDDIDDEENDELDSSEDDSLF